VKLYYINVTHVFSIFSNHPVCSLYMRIRRLRYIVVNLWNSLPVNLTSAPSLTIFRQRLKTPLLALLPWLNYFGLIVDLVVTVLLRPL